MLFTKPEQLIVLAIVLIGGWLLGYASAPSTKKWKRRVREQSDSFTAYYNDVDGKLRASDQRAAELTARVDGLQAQKADAERMIAELRAAAVAPVAPPPVVQAPPPAPIVKAVAETPPAPPPPLLIAELPPVPPVEPVAELPPAATAELIELPPAPGAPVAERTPSHGATEPWHVVPEAEEAAEAAAPEGGLAAARDAFPHIEDAAAPAADAAPSAAQAVEAVAPEPSEPPAPIEAGAEPVAPMTPAPATAAPAPIGPAEPEMPSKGWLASSARDDLTRVRGIDAPLNTRLFSLGVTRFEDIEKLSAEDEMALEQRLAMPVGYIGREQWRTQAALLRAGRHDEHDQHFGAVEA